MVSSGLSVGMFNFYLSYVISVTFPEYRSPKGLEIWSSILSVLGLVARGFNLGNVLCLLNFRSDSQVSMWLENHVGILRHSFILAFDCSEVWKTSSWKQVKSIGEVSKQSVNVPWIQRFHRVPLNLDHRMINIIGDLLWAQQMVTTWEGRLISI